MTAKSKQRNISSTTAANQLDSTTAAAAATNNNSAAEPRRANKPLMEKRRRARINQSLAALKALILDSAKADNTKHSKLEKADILELTVRHFQRHRSLDTAGVLQYRAGYADCVREVQRYLDTPDAHTMTLIDQGVRQRLLRHLDGCIQDVDMDLKQQHDRTNTEAAAADSSSSSTTNSIVTELEVNNNSQQLINSSTQPLQRPPSPQVPMDFSTTTNNVIAASGAPGGKIMKSHDGSLVFVLPSHYLQLASALGINLRPHSDSPDDLKTIHIKQELTDAAAGTPQPQAVVIQHQQVENEHEQIMLRQQHHHHHMNHNAIVVDQNLEQLAVIAPENVDAQQDMDCMWRPW